MTEGADINGYGRPYLDNNNQNGHHTVFFVILFYYDVYVLVNCGKLRITSKYICCELFILCSCLTGVSNSMSMLDFTRGGLTYRHCLLPCTVFHLQSI